MNEYKFPNINCKQNSAWHKWSEAGAIFVALNPNADYETAANEFASEGNTNSKDSAIYRARFFAFIEGVTNCDLLEIT